MSDLVTSQAAVAEGMHLSTDVTSVQLRKYCACITAWRRRYDTFEIGALFDLPEELVARWIANFQDMTHGNAA